MNNLSIPPARDYWCPTCKAWIPEIVTLVVDSPVTPKVRNHSLIRSQSGKRLEERHTVCSRRWEPPARFES